MALEECDSVQDYHLPASKYFQVKKYQFIVADLVHMLDQEG